MTNKMRRDLFRRPRRGQSEVCNNKSKYALKKPTTLYVLTWLGWRSTPCAPVRALRTRLIIYLSI